MILGKLKVILVVTRHSSKFCTRFGHVQVERDFGSAPCAFFFAQLKPFFKKGATGCHALDSTSASPLVLTQQRHYVQAHYQFTTYNDLCQFFIHALST